jgi:uncharacterized protein (TIRG00374 family)
MTLLYPSRPGSPPLGPEAKRRKRRRLPRPVKRVIGLLVAFFLLEYLVIPRLVRQRGHLNLLTHINLWFVLAGLVLEAGSLLAYALLTRTILSQFGEPPAIRTLVQVDLSTLALTRVLPGGSAAGTGLGFRLLTALGYSNADAGLTLAVQGIGSAAILNALLWIGLVMSIPLRALHHSGASASALPKTLYVTAALLGAFLVGFFGFAVISLTRGRDRSLRVVRAVARRVRFLHEEQIVGVVQRIADQLRTLVSDRRLLVREIAYASANWLLDAGALWVLVAAFHYHLTIDALLIAYALANIVAVLPLTPGGLGVVEVVLTSTLTAFGAPGQVATLGVIAYRLVSFWLPIPVGGLAYLTLKLDPRFKNRQVQQVGTPGSSSRAEGEGSTEE